MRKSDRARARRSVVVGRNDIFDLMLPAFGSGLRGKLKHLPCLRHVDVRKRLQILSDNNVAPNCEGNKERRKWHN